MSTDERTCQDSVGPDRCEVCEQVLIREEIKRGLGLCDRCARDVDEGYESRRDDLYWPGWFDPS